MAKQLSLKELLSVENIEDKLSDLPFEQGVTLLEELVEQVEAGALPLDDAISAYERGVTVLSHLRSLLDGAEKKLEILQD